jgi:hypothetical protein
VVHGMQEVSGSSPLSLIQANVRTYVQVG